MGFRDGIVRTVVGLDRETQAAYALIVEAIGILEMFLSLFSLPESSMLSPFMLS